MSVYLGKPDIPEGVCLTEHGRALYTEIMSLFERLGALVDAAHDDKCSGKSFSLRQFIHMAQTPRGACPILKVAMTSACENNCYYCALRRDRDVRRTRITSDEMARAFMELHSKGMVEGIFLTSGVRGGPVRSMDEILATGELLRHKYGFRGYVHLKIMPGADEAQVEAACRLADRVSVNLEAPNAERLSRLSPDKSFREQLGQAIREMKKIIERTESKAGQTTQMVVGAAGETDREILVTTEKLYRVFGLKRVYYSPFRPVSGTPLEDMAPENPKRTARLYQADFLLRDYGFSADDIPMDENERVPTGADPKMIWAKLHPERFPIDLAKADYQELIMVPGIGPKTAKKILQHRARYGISPADLRGLGVIMKRACQFITVRGQRALKEVALSLF
ncbi:MAG: radical SAM protein [candidate division WOR-3 bacterium]